MPFKQPLTIYAYLFLPEFGDVLEYKVVYEQQQYVIRKTELDSELNAYYEPDVWRTGERLSDAVRDVTQDLRSLYKQTSGKPTMPDTDLPEVYLPMIFGIDDAAEAGNLASVAIIGEKQRYKNQQGVDIFLGSFGYGYICPNSRA
jgi:hypothetical protein